MQEGDCHSEPAAARGHVPVRPAPSLSPGAVLAAAGVAFSFKDCEPASIAVSSRPGPASIGSAMRENIPFKKISITEPNI